MGQFRRNLVLAGVVGLVASACLVGIALWLVTSGIVKPPFPYVLVELLLAIVLGGFSVAEIPIMVFAMRRLLAGSTRNEGIATSLNGLYVFFAAVYAVPVGLLTGDVVFTLALSALSIVRFASSLAFVRRPVSDIPASGSDASRRVRAEPDPATRDPQCTRQK